MPLYIGLMSGTSMDAVDAALVDFENSEIKVLHYLQYAFPEPLLVQLQASQAKPEKITALELGQLHRRLGQLFAEAATQLLTDTGLDRSHIAAIGSHGQTLLHSPASNPAFTLQLGDPSTIAASTGITTIADFRAMDMAVGGQGAPLAPAFHNAAFRSHQINRVLVNIGGIGNITLLPVDSSAPVIGFDTGPGNTLMDSWCQQHLGSPFDRDGKWALTGQINQELLECLLDDSYFRMPFPKSTGRDYFNMKWLEQKAGDLLTQHPSADVQATLLALTVESICQAIEASAPDLDEVLVCGGGAFNQTLMQQLTNRLNPHTVATTAARGFDPNCIEAVCFAWLAMRRLHKLPGNLPSVTGAGHSVCLGGIYQA